MFKAERIDDSVSIDNMEIDFTSRSKGVKDLNNLYSSLKYRIDQKIVLKRGNLGNLLRSKIVLCLDDGFFGFSDQVCVTQLSQKVIQARNRVLLEGETEQFLVRENGNVFNSSSPMKFQFKTTSFWFQSSFVFRVLYFTCKEAKKPFLVVSSKPFKVFARPNKQNQKKNKPKKRKRVETKEEMKPKKRRRTMSNFNEELKDLEDIIKNIKNPQKKEEANQVSKDILMEALIKKKPKNLLFLDEKLFFDRIECSGKLEDFLDGNFGSQNYDLSPIDSYSDFTTKTIQDEYLFSPDELNIGYNSFLSL